MKLSAIAACAANGTIGKDNDLPWHLPADLKYFKQVTLGKPVIMGRRTFESLDGPLPGRLNIILTRQPDWKADDVEVAHSLHDALEVARREAREQEQIMILGGAKVYEELLPECDRLYLTVVHEEFEGDTFFPAFDIGQWELVEADHHDADDKNAYPYSFYVMERSAEQPASVEGKEEEWQLPEALQR